MTPRRLGSPASAERRARALRQSFDALLDLGGAVKQQAVAFEEIAAVGLPDQRKQLRVFCERLRQRVGGQFGILGSRRFHDHRNAFLRKGLGQLQLTLVPRQVLRNQSFDIGIDGESRRIIDRGPEHQQRSQNNDGPPEAGTEIDDPDNH